MKVCLPASYRPAITIGFWRVLRRARAGVLLLVCSLALTACSNFGFPGVYRISIQQGNIIDAEDVDELRIGMTKSQVKYLLGTPMITDPFHKDRWDYFYSLRDPKGDTKQMRLTLRFEGDLLKYIQQMWADEEETEKS